MKASPSVTAKRNSDDLIPLINELLRVLAQAR